MKDTPLAAAAATTTTPAGGAPGAYSASARAADARNRLALAHVPGFTPYPNLCWTAGPWKPEYEPWTFEPPHFCDICNCLPDKCLNFGHHFSSDPVREAQANAMLEGKNAFQAATDVQAGRTPRPWSPGSTQLEDPEAKSHFFQLGWDVALAQAPRREHTLARVEERVAEHALELAHERVKAKGASIAEQLQRAHAAHDAAVAKVALCRSKLDASQKHQAGRVLQSAIRRRVAKPTVKQMQRAAIVLQRAARRDRILKAAFHVKVDRFFDKFNKEQREK